MDPASLAFGVVSLAMQLMQTTAAIRRLIADYKSAPKDLAVLVDKLDDIEAVCHSLEVVLANFDEIRNPWEATLLNKLYKAISDCRDKVSLAYDAVHKVTARHRNGRASLATVGSLFLQHRAQIRQCNDDLDRSLSSLQLHMTTNILAANMGTPVMSIKDRALVSTPSMVEETVLVKHQNHILPSYKDNSDTHVTRWRRGWSTLGYLQTKRTLKTTPGFSETDSPKTDQDLSFLAAVPMLKLYVKLSVRRGSLSPLSVSLHFPHVIDLAPGSTEVGDRLASALLYDDVEAVRDCFCKGLLTPFSTVTWSGGKDTDEETTVYGYAIVYNANDVCRFLVEQLPDSLRRTSSHISPRPPILSGGDYYGLKQLAFDYVDLKGDSLTTDEFSIMLNAISSPARDVKTYADYCKQRLPDRWKPFNICLYSYIVKVFELWYDVRRYDIMDNGWARILADVLSNGVDIHTITWTDRGPLEEFREFSAVHRIISMAGSPQMALERCRLWLDLLERVGVDIEKYLDVEIEHCTATWDQKSTDMDTDFRKIFAIQEFGGRRVPYWIQEIDDTCLVRELLLEFPHFTMEEIYRFWMKPSSTPDVHRTWKDPMTQLCLDGSPTWPFYRPLDWTMIDTLRRFWQPKVTKRQVSALDRARDLMQSRFKRKQMRKLRKAGQRCPDRMPGAWVDEW